MARMPATPKQGIARSVLLRPNGNVRGNPTQPSLPRNPPIQTQSPAGGALRASPRPGRTRGTGGNSSEFYLWVLVAVEVTLIGGLRQAFKRYHGG